ncbi:MAG: NADH-dependent phenylglyoxylate dehydrogenase subunit gamma [bacterium ADurb.Bin212]|nr:MAG: NADH-dependent phenylglyoxylate dehydrogenase subunit gamma [bacterium ADurb.Bin212]
MNKNTDTIKILLAGEGGQGVQTIAKIITETAAQAGKEVAYIPYFGVEQRGTPSISFVTISSSLIRYPRFEAADVACIVISRAINKSANYISPNTEIIFDSSTVDTKKFPKTFMKFKGLQATKIAAEKFGQKSFNMIILGLLAKKLGLDFEIVWQVAQHNLADKLKDNSIKENNHNALQFGYEAVLEESKFPKPIYETKKSISIYKNSEKTAIIDPSLCKGCGICIEKCPVKALSFGDDLGVFAFPVPKIDLEKCIICGNCRRFCPDGAIGVDKNSK